MNKDTLIRFTVEKTLFQVIIEKLNKVLSDALFGISLRYLTKNTKVQENKIIFLTFRGEYDCNAKWIAEELRKRKLPYKIVWAVHADSNTQEVPPEFTVAVRGTYEFYQHLASAKIIVDNGISTAHLKYHKKKEQILMETWHGSIGIKKFSKDTNKDQHWCALAQKEGEMTDYCLSNSTFETELFRDTFWPKAKIFELGHARNDILCEKGTEQIENIRQKVYTQFNLAPDTKICLYAPTFRDDGDSRPYKIDYRGLQNALKQRFGGNWVIMTRFHFRLRNTLMNYRFPDSVINGSAYVDIQELLTCADVGITDYSSWICDYMLTKRPGFLFATDMTEYEEKDREFFYPLNSMPFPLALDNDQLIENILNFDNEVFIQQCDVFLKDKGCIDDGHSSERIADVIEQIMRGEVV